MVRPDLVATWLVKAYKAEHRDGEADAITELSVQQRAEQARRAFGSPPRRELFQREEHWRWLIPLLKSAWLPQLPGASLQELSREVQYEAEGRVVGAPHCQLLKDLQERRATEGYRLALRKAFIRVHRRPGEAHRHSPTQVLEPRLTVIELRGRGAPHPHTPWEHQQDAWNKLDALRFASDRPGVASGLIVLPTGSGKTDVAVTWLLRHALRQAPRKRVLWLAHQQELLEQVLRRFQLLVSELPATERIRVRICHGGAASVTTLADRHTDVALVTIQSLCKDFAAKKVPVLRAFTRQRPTIVVVDEAHHAGSNTYHRVLTELEGRVAGMLGLTATPSPMSPLSQARLRQHFPPPPIAKAGVEELVRRGILARQVVESIQTRFEVSLTARELAMLDRFPDIRFPDIRPDILAKLDEGKRNELIVRTYAEHSDVYGETLVYATSIRHADTLAAMFAEQGVEAKVLHSRVEDRDAPLQWFKAHRRQAVLVSVGMLTEGVDLPDAQTVFLARPTTSRVLLRQMIGRAMRGPRAGGGPRAYIVSFEDYWQHFSGVLAPEDVLEGAFETREPQTGEIRRPPPLHVQGNREVPSDVAAHIQRMYTSLPFDVTVLRRPLVGWYTLDDRHVAVFEHQHDAFRRFLEAATVDLRGTPLLAYFDDVPDPVPAPRDLGDLRDYVRLHGEPPTFEAVGDDSTPRLVAERIRSAGPLTIEARHAIVAEAYQAGPSRLVYPSLDAFERAVDDEVQALVRGQWSYDGSITTPEHPPPRRLVPQADRDLAPLVADVVHQAKAAVDPALRGKLDTLPPVRWSRRVVGSYWGQFVFKRTGKGAGKSEIVLNRLLCTRPSIVKDQTLQFIIYHEVLHHLLPFNGHDAHFCHLEAQWPGFLDAEREIDTLADRFDLRPSSYRDW